MEWLIEISISSNFDEKTLKLTKKYVGISYIKRLILINICTLKRIEQNITRLLQYYDNKKCKKT